MNKQQVIDICQDYGIDITEQALTILEKVDNIDILKQMCIAIKMRRLTIGGQDVIMMLIRNTVPAAAGMAGQDIGGQK